MNHQGKGGGFSRKNKVERVRALPAGGRWSEASVARLLSGPVMMLTLWMMLMSMVTRILEAAVDDAIDGDDDAEESRQRGLLSAFCCG